MLSIIPASNQQVNIVTVSIIAVGQGAAVPKTILIQPRERLKGKFKSVQLV